MRTTRFPSGLRHKNRPLTCGNAGEGPVAVEARKGRRGSYVGHALDLLPLLFLAAFLVALAPGVVSVTPVVESPWGYCTHEMRGVVGSPCYDPETVTPDHAGILAEAAEVAELTVGMECWDPSTGRVGTHLVVRGLDEAVSVVPFNDETYARAAAGEFWTIKACEVA